MLPTVDLPEPNVPVIPIILGIRWRLWEKQSGRAQESTCGRETAISAMGFGLNVHGKAEAARHCWNVGRRAPAQEDRVGAISTQPVERPLRIEQAFRGIVELGSAPGAVHAL